MMRQAILMILIAPCLSATLVAQDKAKAVVPIPTTISQEAQEFLRNAPPIEANPETLEGWEVRQAEAEKNGKAESKKVVDAFAEKVEVRKMGGVGA